jgi:hypothetical protein
LGLDATQSGEGPAPTIHATILEELTGEKRKTVHKLINDTFRDYELTEVHNFATSGRKQI